jgi:hypothetical protein
VARFTEGMKLGSTAEDCLTNAEQCEDLAKHARDTVVRAALTHAARQWRKRAELRTIHPQPGCAALESGEAGTSCLGSIARLQKEL